MKRSASGRLVHDHKLTLIIAAVLIVLAASALAMQIERGARVSNDDPPTVVPDNVEKPTEGKNTGQLQDRNDRREESKRQRDDRENGKEDEGKRDNDRVRESDKKLEER